jgi:hypothetical protein
MTGPRVTVHTLGAEREPVAVIENFAADPVALLAIAATSDFSAAGNHYPGLRAALPPAYLADQRGLLATVLHEVFGTGDRLRVLDAGFAIVTTPAAALSLVQRLPHVDALEPGRLALIHYLVPGGTTGTGFYRHRTTGFETVDAARAPPYFAALNADVRRHAPPPAYLAGSTPLFEQTGSFDGVFNRALLYRGRMLHSGIIAPGGPGSADPANARLTITGFFATEFSAAA